MTYTVVIYDDKLCVQRKSICIYSAVPPVLFDLFLSIVGCCIKNKLQVPQIVKVFRYDGDFLVILNDVADLDMVIDDVFHVFQNESQGLNFTHEANIAISRHLLAFCG